MIEVPVYDKAGESVGQVQVDDARLGGELNKSLLRQALIAYEANQRTGTAKAKTRAEVHGSNRKPWPQKGTGRARAGTRKSGLWKGGGVIFGPQPRDFSHKLSKNARRGALQSAVLAKMADGEVKIVESLELPEPRTREMAHVLQRLGVTRSFLIVLDRYDPVLWRCTRNIPGSAMTTASDLNALSVLKTREVIFTRRAFDEFMGKKAKPPQSPEAELPAEANAGVSDNG